MKTTTFFAAIAASLLLLLNVQAQTLFVPSGTSGIGNSIAPGFVGIGTNNPVVNLEVKGTGPNSRISNSTGLNMGFAVSESTGGWGIPANSTTIYSQRNDKFVINSGGVYNSTRADLIFTSGFNNTITNMTILGQTGQVGIGTNCMPADGKLAVNGKIYATSVQVKLAGGTGCFPDYVFAPEYKLSSLREVENYIKKNKHLPGIPTAEEVEKDGMNVGDLNTKMLEKIEELTLYVIELEKKIEALKK